MPIFVILAAVFGFLVFLILKPEFRVMALLIAAPVVALLTWYFWASEAETDLAYERIAPDEVTIDLTDLEVVGNRIILNGRAVNGSGTWRLREVTVLMRALDCPTEESTTAECLITGEATALFRPDIPAGQARSFRAAFLFDHIATATGIPKFDWEITATRATQ